MCTPPERKLPLAAPGHRVLRMRELFDTYVRPLTQLPDGGGVLLPQAQVETWMPGVGWLPMAFRVPKNKVPGCLFSQYGAAHRLQRPQRSGSDAPPQASSDDVADDADASGSSRDGSSSPSPTRRRGRGGCEADSRTDSGADLSPTSSPSPTQAIALRTRARENAGDGGCGEVPSTGHVRHGPSEAQTTARGLERPRNTPGGVPFIDSNQGAARLFALTFNTTRADVILALVGSGELPGLKRKYRDTAGRAPGALDACVRAVRDVSVLSDRQLGARAIISKVSKIARALRQLAEARMRKAALGFTVKGADARARGSRPAFRRADNAESARLCPATDAAHLASFKRLVLRRDGRLQLGGGSLLHCLAATCVDAIPGYGALLADSVEGQVRLTPGLLAGVLVEAEDMCTPVGEKLPSGRSKYLPRMLRMRHMYDAHVRPLMSLPDGGGVLLPQAHVAAWLPGVHWVPAAFRVPEDEIALCSVGTTLVKTVKGRRKRQRSADDDDSSHGGAGAQQLPQQRRKRRRA
ncbi:unnamed protein product [Pedinophyceae sp. YPF-701]|nr:unnamed protein product [Pedinophyceae sp. YPF-701]